MALTFFVSNVTPSPLPPRKNGVYIYTSIAQPKFVATTLSQNKFLSVADPDLNLHSLGSEVSADPESYQNLQWRTISFNSSGFSDSANNSSMSRGDDSIQELKKDF